MIIKTLSQDILCDNFYYLEQRADFSTWFSQLMRTYLEFKDSFNPLIFHVSQYGLHDGLYWARAKRSSNGKPSGLPDDQWRDLWWNLIAMVDPEAAIADYNTMSSSYDNEAGESKAHTYLDSYF